MNGFSAKRGKLKLLIPQIKMGSDFCNAKKFPKCKLIMCLNKKNVICILKKKNYVSEQSKACIEIL